MNELVVFVFEYSLVIGTSMLGISIGIVFLLVVRFGTEFFAIYRNNFVTLVDKGFRDVLIYLDPSQVFIVSLGLIVVLVPIVYLFVGVWGALVILIATMAAPKLLFQSMRERRSDEFVTQLPDTLVSLSASLRAGLNLVKSLNQISKNQPDPIASEFAQVLVEYRVGHELNDSLNDLAKRINREELILMNSGIRISREVGGNLSETLDVLAKTLKAKAEAQGKVKALTSMGRAQAVVAVGLPLIVGGVFSVVEPAAMTKLFTTELGRIWLSIMFVMMCLALYAINKIVNVDV